MTTKEDLTCHYSGLPSPSSYECADYDSMGNHGRFLEDKPKKKSIIKRIKSALKNDNKKL
jgi:hypothetical protein